MVYFCGVESGRPAVGALCVSWHMQHIVYKFNIFLLTPVPQDPFCVQFTMYVQKILDVIVNLSSSALFVSNY